MKTALSPLGFEQTLSSLWSQRISQRIFGEGILVVLAQVLAKRCLGQFLFSDFADFPKELFVPTSFTSSKSRSAFFVGRHAAPREVASLHTFCLGMCSWSYNWHIAMVNHIVRSCKVGSTPCNPTLVCDFYFDVPQCCPLSHNMLHSVITHQFWLDTVCVSQGWEVPLRMDPLWNCQEKQRKEDGSFVSLHRSPRSEKGFWFKM